MEMPLKMESAFKEVSCCSKVSITVRNNKPVYRHLQEECCTTDLRGGRPMALGRDHDRHVRLQQLRN